MSQLDETDLEILSMLLEDGRRPFSDIGEAVGLTGPAVSDRVTRLRESGVIERFTVDVDRSQLRAGIPVFVRAEADGEEVADLRDRVADSEAVEYVFLTADGEVWFHARAESGNVRPWLESLLGVETDFEVTLLDDAEWEPSLAGTTFALACAECGNTVDSEGESARIDGDAYHFCCPSCLHRFRERYDRIEEGA
jgi:DNA-binding Lrp family transcriptional regulator/YHS domain-containing protein